MEYENYNFNVGTENFEVIHCLGHGQCSCDSCGQRSWTFWFYKLNKDDNRILCRSCLGETLIQRRIAKAIAGYDEKCNNLQEEIFRLKEEKKNMVKEIYQMVECWEDKPYVSKEDFKESIKQLYGAEVSDGR